MSSIELPSPGLWIEGDDRDSAFKSLLTVRLVQQLFDEAVVSLQWYEQQRDASTPCVVPSREKAARRQVAAKAFVFSLDSIGKMLTRLSAKSPPEKVREAIVKFREASGHLKHIRDSVAHLEDRGRGVDKEGEKIATSVLILGSFSNDSYTFTGSDGSQYSVAVSADTLEQAREVLTEVVEGFQWSGVPFGDVSG